MAYVLCQVTGDTLVKPLRHSETGLETPGGELLRQLAEVVDDRDVLRTEEAGRPVVAQAKAEDELVHPFGLSGAGSSGHDQQALQFEGAETVEILPSGLGARTEAVFVKGTQLHGKIVGRESALKRHLFGLRQGDAETLYAILHQMLVGILTLRPVGDDAAAFGAETAEKFGTQLQACGIGIHGDVDEPFVLEMALHKTVEPGEVSIGAGGHGYRIRTAGGEEGSGIELALGDDAFGGIRDGVDVVRDKLGTGDHLEMLGAATILDIDQCTLFEVVETKAVLLLSGLRHRFRLFREPQRGDDGLGDATLFHQPALHPFGEQQRGGIERRAAEMCRHGRGGRGGFPLAGLPFFAFAQLGFVGHMGAPSAMMAVAQSGVEVHGKGFVAFVAPQVVALRTVSLYFAAGTSGGFDVERMKISHIWKKASPRPSPWEREQGDTPVY